MLKFYSNATCFELLLVLIQARHHFLDEVAHLFLLLLVTRFLGLLSSTKFCYFTIDFLEEVVRTHMPLQLSRYSLYFNFGPGVGRLEYL